MPQEVEFYLDSAWARGRIPLIDFLRKTNAKGYIVDWLVKAHTASGREDTI